MTQIKGTNVVAPVVPLDTADVYPSHEARYGKGGYRTVATTTERDAIPAPRREAGMLVYVAASGGSLWQLGSDLTTWTAFETGGGAPDAHAASHGAAGSDPVTIAGSQISGGALPANATLTFADGTSDAEVGGWGFGVELTADNAVYATVEPSAVQVHNATGYAALQSQAVYFSNGTSLAVGTFDIGLSGYNGISLNCAVGVELNWQAGHLQATTDAGVTPADIIVDSPLRFPGGGPSPVGIDNTGLTFNDGSTQTVAWQGSATFSEVADTTTYVNFNTTAGSLADALSGIDSAISGRLRYRGVWDQTTNNAGGYVSGDVVKSGEALYALDSPESTEGQVPGDAIWPQLTFDGAYTSLTSVPSTFDPSAHKTSHATGGSDALSPSDIGAASLSHAHSATADLTFAGATAGQVLTVNSGATALVWATPTTYSLPDATNSVKGGVIVGSGLSVSSGTISVITYAVRSDTVSSTSYIGRAVSGSATSASVWTIRRTVLTSAGAVSATTTATNVKWDDRLTASYS